MFNKASTSFNPRTMAARGISYHSSYQHPRLRQVSSVMVAERPAAWSQDPAELQGIEHVDESFAISVCGAEQNKHVCVARPSQQDRLRSLQLCKRKKALYARPHECEVSKKRTSAGAPTRPLACGEPRTARGKCRDHVGRPALAKTYQHHH